jgi:sodium/bile acid cotransporter 7
MIISNGQINNALILLQTGQAGGNQALTVTQSTLGNIIGVFLTPALFKAYTSTGAWYTAVLPNEPGGNGELYRRVFKRLGLSVFIPLVSPIYRHITSSILI